MRTGKLEWMRRAAQGSSAQWWPCSFPSSDSFQQPIPPVPDTSSMKRQISRKWRQERKLEMRACGGRGESSIAIWPLFPASVCSGCLGASGSPAWASFLPQACGKNTFTDSVPNEEGRDHPSLVILQASQSCIPHSFICQMFPGLFLVTGYAS